MQFVDTDVRVGDSDNALMHSATLSITDVKFGDLLTAFGLPAGITPALFDPITGVLVLQGTASWADCQLALRGVAFSTTANATGGSARVIEITLDDSAANSNVALSQISVSSSTPSNAVRSSPGDDVMTGTAGQDVFHWSLADQGSFAAPARDIVTNFGPATTAISRSGDVLDLRYLLVGGLHAPNVGSRPGVVTADVGNLDHYLHFSLVSTGAATPASTVISVRCRGGYTGGVYNAGAVDQVITLAGVNLMAGFTIDHQVLDDLLKRGKLNTDTA